MVYARHKGAPPNTPPYFLEDGTARDKALKDWVKDHLECLMPECPNRLLSAVNRSEHSGRRDGFSHRKGAGKHAPEGLFHQQGKALIQSWVNSAYPDAVVALELATETRERIADVMIDWPTGERIAVEIQYAALTVEAWLARHQSYLDQGITPIWLLGHHGAHMKAARAPHTTDWDTAAGQVQLTLLQQKMIEYDATVLWINPIDRTVATPWTVERADHRSPVYNVYCTPATERAFITIDNLDQCELDPERGLVPPAMRLIEEAERLRRLEEQRRIDEAKRLQAEKDAEAAYNERLLAKQREAWETSALAAVFDQRWSRTPDLLGVLPGDSFDRSGVWAYPTYWRGVIYEELIHAFALGDTPTLEDQMLSGALMLPRHEPHFTVGDVYAALEAHGIRYQDRDRERVSQLVRWFLQRLGEYGVLNLCRGWAGHTLAFEVTGKTLAQAEAEYQQANDDRQRAINQRRVAQGEALQRAAEKRRERAERNRRPWSPNDFAVDPAQDAARSQCNRCGRPLPSWQRGGYHTSGCY